MSLVLGSGWRSSCSWRVRIALALKGLPFDTVSVHLVADGGHQHTKAYQALNPMREVPVLIDEGHVLAQSVAILEYLEERHPAPALLPSHPVERARVRQMVELINSGIQPIQNLRVMQRLGREFGLDKDAQRAWSRGCIESGFVALERLLERHAGTYSFGDALSLADLCLVPQVYNARRFEVDLTRFPTLVAIEARLGAIEAFQHAHPDAQPDAP